MKTFLLTTLAALILPLAAQAESFYVKSQDHLTRAKGLLEKPNTKKEKRRENAVSNQLAQALADLESGNENRGSARSLAIKAIKAAQAELAAGDDEAHRAKALEYVNEALDKVAHAIDVKR